MHEDFEPENAKEMHERLHEQLTSLIYSDEMFSGGDFLGFSDENPQKTLDKPQK
jgi:hypothetical protein